MSKNYAVLESFHEDMFPVFLRIFQDEILGGQSVGLEADLPQIWFSKDVEKPFYVLQE